MFFKLFIVFGLIFSNSMLIACRTTETGSRLVDRNRGEIIITAPSSSLTAMPLGKDDKDLTKVREKLEAKVKGGSKDIETLSNLAQIQMAQDRLADAEDTARKILLMDTKNTLAKKVLAHAAIKRGKNDLALIFLTNLDGDRSKDSDVLNMLGIVALNKKQSDEAMRLWNQALSLNPGDISVRMNLGVMYLKNHRLNQASTQFERVLKVSPKHEDARLHLAIVNMSRGKTEDSIKTFEDLLASNKDNQLALFNLAQAQKNNAQHEDAINTLKRFIKTAPNKSSYTDQAFAMIDEINGLLQATNKNIKDDELQSLAGDASAASVKRQDSPKQQGDVALQRDKPENSSQRVMGSDGQAVDQSPSDSEIESLERQLSAPAH
jgi:Flp pilus assembly protein TadD